MADHDSGVIVVGGGIGGLTAAIALQRAGIDVAVYESSDELKEIGAGFGIQYGAMKGLREIGLMEQVYELGLPLKTMEMATPGGKMLATIPHDQLIEKTGVTVHNVHRGEMLGLLIDTFGRDRIQTGAKCVGVEEDDTGVTARFADGRTARGAILVGADGARSTVREQILADGTPRDSGIVVWRAMPPFEHPGAPVGVLHQAFGRGQFFARIPGTKKRVFWFCGALVSQFGEQPKTDRKQELLDGYSGWQEPIGEMIEATDVAAIARNRVYDRTPVDRWGTDRVTLLGDAAHPMIPTLGQGGSTSIEDGIVLAKSLAAADLSDRAAIEGALRAYEQNRIARTAPLVKQARMFARLVLSRNPAVTRFRNLALRLTPASSWQRRYWAQHSYEP